jgi:two-component system CheB/CheR fusion protein
MKATSELVCGSEVPGLNAGPATGDEAAKEHWRSLRIVLVDDDKDTVNTLAAILEDEGHKVLRVYSGVDAMYAIRRFEPHAVICDISMPKVTGYDVVRAIRSQFITYRPLVIAVSGVYVKPSDVVLAQTVGFDHHLTKPVHPDEVLRLLSPLSSKPR